MLDNFITSIDYKKLIELQANGTSYKIARTRNKNIKYQPRGTKQIQKKLRRYQ